MARYLETRDIDAYQYPSELYCDMDAKSCNIFVSPEAPIYVLDGLSGNEEYLKDDTYPLQPWSLKLLGKLAVGILKF